MDQRLNLKKIAHFILPVIYVITLIFLLYSIFVSGFHYTFDSDEFAHAQQTYLIATGNQPYGDFFSIYSPILHWLLLPIFTFFGFTFESIIFARLMMIVTFGIRIIISIYLMRLLFGKRTALIFLPLFLFDPFTIFVSMQIRPDNLMMTFFMTALLLLYLGLSKKSGKITALSGALISLAFLTSIKILPSVVIIILILLIYGIFYNRSKIIKQFLLGFFLTMVIFLSYFLFQNTLPQMIQNVFFDSMANSNAISNPVPLGFFHWPNNAFIFGLGGKPATWIYEWILPFIALIGVYIVFSQVQTKSSKEYLPDTPERRFLKLMLVISFIVQGFALLFIYSVFIQYYLITSWFSACFAAVLVNQIYLDLKKSILWQKYYTIGLLIVYSVLLTVSFRANLERSKINFEGNIKAISTRWEQIPKSAYVYPYLLFRPSVYPLIVGYNIADLPESILNRFPSVDHELEIKKVPYLLLDSNRMRNLKPQVEIYIEEHYQKVAGDDELWIRK